MKDVFTVKRSADSDDVLKQLNGQFFKVMNVSADTELEDVDSGAIICADFSTDGTDITLPKCAAGLYFKVLVTVTAHADAGCKIKVGNAADYFFGVYTLIDSDTQNQLDVQTVIKATAAAAPTDYDNIDLDGNGTAAGGEVGSTLEFIGTDENGWFVNAVMYTTGTPASTAAISAS